MFILDSFSIELHPGFFVYLSSSFNSRFALPPS